MTTVELIHGSIDPQAAVLIDLDAPKFIPADARHISRTLKAAGLKRAERIKGTSGQYTYGFNASGYDLTLFGVNDYNREEALVLLEQCISVLQGKGFAVTRRVGSRLSAHSTVYVFKPVTTADDESTFWYSFRDGAYVAQDGALVRAWEVPAFKDEKKALERRAREQIAANKAREEADRLHAENLRTNLEKAGLPCSVHGNWIHVHAGQLNAWLQSQGIHLGAI